MATTLKSYIYGGEGMPKTPQELERLRAVAQAMMPRRTPQNAGEGIASMGNALAMRIMMNKADKAQKIGEDSVLGDFNGLTDSLFGPTTTPEDTAAVPPVDTAANPYVSPPVDGTMPNARSMDRESIPDYAAQKPLTGDLAETEALIRKTAAELKIDPDIAVKVARSEGLAPGVWQSRVKKGDQYEPSYGAFQMLLGDGKTFPKGMGNDFMEKTGLDPRDPKNHGEMIKFALQTAKKDGWRQWYGAQKAGVNRWDGVNADQVASLDANVPASAMVNPAQEQVPVVPVPDGFQQPDPLAAQQQVQQPVEVADSSNAINPRRKVAQALAATEQTKKAMNVLNNPYANPGQRAVAQAYLKRFFDEQDRAADEQSKIAEEQRKREDPKYKLELEKGQIELGTLKNPPKARTLTDDEEKALNLPIDGVYQEKPDGTIATVREPEKASADWSKLTDGRLFNQKTGEIKDVTGGQQVADFKDVTTLRKEIQDLPSYKNLSQALPIYQSMAETAGRNSKASDLNLVYGMGKIFDPTSVVREGEQVMVRNTASLPDWFQGVVASINGGASLTPETRKALMQEAYSRVKAYDGQFQNDSTQFKGIAARNKFNEADVIPTFSPYAPWQADPASGQMPMDGANATVTPFAKPVQAGDPELKDLSDEELEKLINGGR